MADRPIIFSGSMIRALLDGRKIMTRRLAWGKFISVEQAVKRNRHDIYVTAAGTQAATPWQKVQTGVRLWVRENFALVGGGDPGVPVYAANWREDAKARGLDNIPSMPPKWTPCIHMPRWVSRLTLTVTATKIERLQDITEADAKAEGPRWVAPTWGFDGLADSWGATARGAFKVLWESLHGPDAWAANPEVVALTFTVAQQNIDTPLTTPAGRSTRQRRG